MFPPFTWISGLTKSGAANAINRIQAASTYSKFNIPFIIVTRANIFQDWSGSTENEPEVILIIKCPEKNFDELFRIIKEIHPNEIACILEIQVIWYCNLLMDNIM